MLSLLQIDITSYCNLNCYHCRRVIKKRKELSYKELQDIIKEAKKLGAEEIILSGGEPLLHRDWFKIARFVHNTGLKCILTTNGTLINKKMIKKKYFKNINLVQISLDGTEKIHDKLRRKKGAFSQTLNGAKLLNEAGVNLIIKSIVSCKNIKSLYELAKLLRESGIRYMDIREILPCGRGKGIYKKERISYSEYVKLFKKINSLPKFRVISEDPLLIPHQPFLLNILNKEGNIYDGSLIAGCLVGNGVLYINSYGDIFPCSYLPIKLGNIRHININKILRKNLLKKLGNKNNISGKCGNCKFKFICGGCRAVPFAILGDLFARDPRCKIS